MADPKKNTFLQLQAARKELHELQANIVVMKGWTLQQALDMAQIALNSEFGFGPDRNARFEKVFRTTFREFALLCVDDGKDDPSLDYTKEKVDRMLRQACGDDIKPFDERYALENLYFRDNLEKEAAT